MLDLATYVRIFDANPSDDLIEKRNAALVAIAKKIVQKNDIEEILAFENGIAEGLVTGVLPKHVVDLVEPEIKVTGPSFVHAGNELQTLVCALLAADRVFGDAKPKADWFTIVAVHACANWLAISVVDRSREPKIEELCAAVQNASRGFVNEVADHARQRYEIDEFKASWPDSGVGVEFAKEVVKGFDKTVTCLKENAILDREEIDILWWVLADRSELLQRSFSSASTPQAAIAAALELGGLLRRPPADAHKHLIFRYVKEDSEMSLNQLLDALAPVRGELTLPEKQIRRAKRHPRVFPLALAIAGVPNHGLHGEMTKRLSEWSARALFESSILHLADEPHSSI